MATEYTIYSFVNTANGDTYVGSTKNLHKRLLKHFSQYKNGDQSKVYRLIDESVNGWDDIEIIEIETLTCDVDTARIREEYFRDLLNANMNNNRCHLTLEQRSDSARQYYWNNRDHVSQVKKDYYKNNTDVIIKKVMDRYYNNKEDILRKQKEYKQQNPIKIKEIKRKQYLKHRDKIIEKGKQYYAEHKDHILEKAKQRYLKIKGRSHLPS